MEHIWVSMSNTRHVLKSTGLVNLQYFLKLNPGLFSAQQLPDGQTEDWTSLQAEVCGDCATFLIHISCCREPRSQCNWYIGHVFQLNAAAVLKAQTTTVLYPPPETATGWTFDICWIFFFMDSLRKELNFKNQNKQLFS